MFMTCWGVTCLFGQKALSNRQGCSLLLSVFPKVCRVMTMAGVQVMSYGASAEAAATTAMFTRLLQHSLKDTNGLSQHPAATGMVSSKI